MSKYDYTLFSDGGASRGGTAAGACVIDGHVTGRRRGALVFLGEATNNEAEITAALLGFSFIRLATAKRNADAGPVSIRWVCDSEYVLKSAKDYIHNWQRNGWKTASKDPVKNQGLWRAYLHLSKGIHFTTEHVRGHTGHPENELCDEAATWAKENGEEELLTQTVAKVEIPYASLESWFLVDGRPFLKALRSDREDETDYELLEEGLRELAGRKSETESSGKKIPEAAAPTKNEQEFKSLLQQLGAFASQFEKLGANPPEAKKLAASLKRLMKSAS